MAEVARLPVLAVGVWRLPLQGEYSERSFMANSTPPSLATLGPKGRRTVPFIVLALVVAAFAVLFYRVIHPFVLPLFLAATLAMLTFPIQTAVAQRLRGRNGWAAALLTLAAILLLLGPLTMAVILGLRELYGALVHLHAISAESGRFVLLDAETNPRLAEALQWVNDRTGIETEQLRAWIVKFAT